MLSFKTLWSMICFDLYVMHWHTILLTSLSDASHSFDDLETNSR